MDFVLLLQQGVGLPGFGQLSFKRCALLLVLRARLIDRFLRLLPEALRQVRDQPCQLVVEGLGRRLGRFSAVIQFFQIPVNGGFRAGIAHFDPYRVDAWVFAAGEDCQTGRLNHCFVDAATGHVLSYDFVMWYVPLNTHCTTPS
ncbi:hypothetical protein D3C86_1781510 [compost metagenome]